MIKLSKLLDDKQQQQQKPKMNWGINLISEGILNGEKETAKNYSARDGRVLEPHSITRMH